MISRQLRSFRSARSRHLLVPVAALALAGGVVACGDDDTASSGSGAEVTVAEAWVRQPAEGQPNSAGYGVITNGSDDQITLVGASAPITATFEIHETVAADDGTMSMREREDGFVIDAGETFTLEPGGPHVMMLDIDPAQFTGDIELTFEFDGADPVTVTAELRELDGMAGMGDDGMGDDGDG